MLVLLLSALLVGGLGVWAVLFAQDVSVPVVAAVAVVTPEAPLNMTSEDWELTLAQIAQIASSPDSPRQPAETISFLEFHACNLRSKISLEALLALGVLLPRHPPTDDESWLRVLQMLLLKAINDKKFISTAAKQCLDGLSAPVEPLLQLALANSKSSKLVYEAVYYASRQPPLGCGSDLTALIAQVQQGCKSAPAKALLQQMLVARGTLAASEAPIQSSPSPVKPWKHAS